MKNRWVIATGNAHKMLEFQRILSPMGMQAVSMQEACGKMEIEETGSTFSENAYLKAKAVFDRCGLPTIADDSGLAVDALDGTPGVYSARYCGEETPYPVKFERLFQEIELSGSRDRSARFVCAICCILDQDTVIRVEKTCEGFIGTKVIGANGFGYDPIFMVDAAHSMAELPDGEKDRISHRAKALRALSEQLAEYWQGKKEKEC